MPGCPSQVGAGYDTPYECTGDATPWTTGADSQCLFVAPSGGDAANYCCIDEARCVYELIRLYYPPPTRSGGARRPRTARLPCRASAGVPSRAGPIRPALRGGEHDEELRVVWGDCILLPGGSHGVLGRRGRVVDVHGDAVRGRRAGSWRRSRHARRRGGGRLRQRQALPRRSHVHEREMRDVRVQRRGRAVHGERRVRERRLLRSDAHVHDGRHRDGQRDVRERRGLRPRAKVQSDRALGRVPAGGNGGRRGSMHEPRRLSRWADLRIG